MIVLNTAMQERGKLVKKTLFGKIDNQEVFLFRLENENKMSVTLSNFGALVIRLEVPDIRGNVADVVLGYDTLEEYRKNDNFYGAIVGPNANRIGGAAYTLEGKTYQLDKNDGQNNLHSHKEFGTHKRVWDYAVEENSVIFRLQLKDGEMGFGGNKDISVRYTLTRDNALEITYDVTSDQNTPINMTNHSYFNLDGQGNGNIKDHKLQLFASAFTPSSPDMIPTGKIISVENTPMDFRIMQSFGARINQLPATNGYDHNWALDAYNGSVRKIAVVKNTDETRTMEVYTDLPGIQIYTGNGMTTEKAKDGAIYDRYSGFALETQFFPDSVNKPQFPSCIFGPDKPYHTTTIYQF